ncbi:MAG: THUMP domain-containing protein [Candidatus Caldarchaeum sp.]
MKFFATTYSGLEDVAAFEISKLLNIEAERDVEKVFFDGSLEDCVKLNYGGQTVNKVFLMLLKDKVERLSDVETLAQSLDYTWVIERDQSFAVRAERIGVHSFTSLDIAAAVGKAVIESYKAATGVRLKVDLRQPDVEICAILRDSELLISVNTTGESLHRRYYRAGYHRAALSPTIANALVRLSGWKPSQSLLDPFCGSGTIPLEAALYGLCVSPGLRRGVLAFEKLKFIDPDVAARCRMALHKMEKVGERLEITGLDISTNSIAVAQSSLAQSGLGETVKFMVGDVLALEKFLEHDVDRVVCNPPFGVRMRLKEPAKFYTEAFTSIRRSCPDATLTTIVSKPTIAVKAMETSSYTPISIRKILLGPVAGYVLTAV